MIVLILLLLTLPALALTTDERVTILEGKMTTVCLTVPCAVAVPVPPPPITVPTLTVSSQAVAPGGSVTVGIQNAPGNNLDWVGLFASSAADSPELSYFYLNGSVNSTKVVTMPSTAGTYNFRLFSNNSYTKLATSPTVTVGQAASVPPPVPPPTTGCANSCFYVSTAGNDSNPGTPTQPWRTIGKASTTLSAGQTGVVMDGTYTEGAIAFRKSGVAVAPVTLMAQNKGKAILASLSGCKESISINASYVTIQDMRLSVAPSEPMPSGCSTANYVVHVWNSNEPTPGNPGTGNVGFILRGTTVDFSSHRNGGLKNRQDTTLVEGNTFNDSVEDFKSQGTIIRNNTFFSPSKSWVDMIVVKGGARGTKIYGNTLHITSSTHTGILLGGTTGNQWLFDPATGIESYDGEAYNNTVLNETSSSIGLWGFAGAKNGSVHHNAGNRGASFKRSGGLPGSVGSTNPGSTFTNNTIDGVLVP
jgi:hypothetical protein